MERIKTTNPPSTQPVSMSHPSGNRTRAGLAAVIVAAGAGTRIGFDKVFAPLGGRPLFLHSVEVFSRSGFVGEVVVVGGAGKCARLRGELDAAGFGSVRVAPGGVERMDSVIEGLRALEPWSGLVAIHDAARPLLTKASLQRCHEAARRTGAAACAEPLADTIHRAGADRILTAPMDRGGIWRMQTPQIFRRTEILDALIAARKEGRVATDDAGVAIAAGIRVELVEPDGWNFKVTRPADYELARLVIAGQHERPA